MESFVFIALAPFALTLMGAVGVVAWRRRPVPGGQELAVICVTAASWLTFDALSLLVPGTEATLGLARTAAAISALPSVAWIAFLLSYTGRLTRAARWGVGLLASWTAVFVALGLTNDAHHWVWTSTETFYDGPFLDVIFERAPLSFIQMALSWVTVAASLGLALWEFATAEPKQRVLMRWIVAGVLVPLLANVVFVFEIGPYGKDFTPLALAVSAGAFALGLTRYKLLDLLPVAREALVDNLREGVLVLDATGRVADANPECLQVLGADAAVRGRPLRDTAPALAEAIETAPGEAFQLGDGEEARYVELRISALSNEDGEPTGSLVLLHDVTRRRREQAELHRVNAELQHRNEELQARNEELDAFSHTVAHDLKNSVQGVIGWGEILRDDGAVLSPLEHHEAADGVVSVGHKMGTIIHELLLLAGVRKTAVEPRPMEMGAVVAEALSRLQHAGAAPTATVPSQWPVALGHAPWVEEVWVNYLSNAAKYGGPTVTLGADTTATGQARFWVHDDGPGLTPEQQQALFEPFARVGSGAAEGHGLGLSIVRRISERLGGACGVESAPIWGTTFWFELPLASDTSLPEAPPRARRGTSPRTSPHVSV